MLSSGDEAPPFELEDQRSSPASLSSFRGRKVLVYFYPETDV